MLKNIKNIINRKKDFLEAAEIIFEDGNGNLDDIIVLGENNDEESYYSEEDDDEPVKEIDDDGEGDEENIKSTDSEDNDDILNEPTENNLGSGIDNTDNNPMEDNMVNDNSDDILNSNISSNGIDDLPTPVGRQTGEPIDDNNDLLDVTIDLQSNTINDILPVPPRNAAEAIAGDEMNQHVPSGFENDENNNDDILDETSGEDENESNQFAEAISLNGSDEDNKDSTDNIEDAAADTSDSQEQSEEENEVTSAVRDKVAEADEDILDDTADENNNTNADKDILNKLGSVTKGIEDVKKMLINKQS